MAKQTRTLEQKQAELQMKLNKLQARKRAVATREKIVVGAAICGEAISSPEIAKQLCEIVSRRVTRESDKAAVADLMKRLGCQSKQSDFAEAPKDPEQSEGRGYTSPPVTSAQDEKPVGGEAPPPPLAGDTYNSSQSRLGRLNLLRR